MIASELTRIFNEIYGLDGWPKLYEVDYETYAEICQFIFNKSEEYEYYKQNNGPSISIIRLALGPNEGIVFKNVELILKRNNEFKMTIEEVRYFVESIKYEYLSKDTYQESKALIERMEKFLEQQTKENENAKSTESK